MVRLTWILAVFFLADGIAHAQYVVVLKNGRQLTVANYREDGSMIKFPGMGGEIAIAKDQIQTIRRAESSDRSSTPTLKLDESASAGSPPPIKKTPPPGEITPQSAAPSSDEQLAKKRAEEEKAYQEKIKELTEKLRELRDRYSLLTRGNKGPEPFLFTTEEEFRGHQEDLLSRLRDAQNRAQGLPRGSAATSPQFALDPPPAYSEKQKELSDLRARMGQVENERQALIEEMKTKNFDTGSLFLD